MRVWSMPGVCTYKAVRMELTIVTEYEAHAIRGEGEYINFITS